MDSYIEGTRIRQSRQALQNHWIHYPGRCQTFTDLRLELRLRGHQERQTRYQKGSFVLWSPRTTLA